MDIRKEGLNKLKAVSGTFQKYKLHLRIENSQPHSMRETQCGLSDLNSRQTTQIINRIEYKQNNIFPWRRIPSFEENHS
jgi:hypothetical protein